MGKTVYISKNITIPEPLFSTLERMRGDIPRSVFIVRILEKALKNKGQERRSEK